MKIDIGTVYSTIFLALVTFMLIYGVFLTTHPKFVLDKNKKFSVWKSSGVSLFFAVIFAICTAIISLRIDQVSNY